MGVVSRMNLGQLIEIHESLVKKHGINYKSSEEYRPFNGDSIDIEKLKRALMNLGSDEEGYFNVEGKKATVGYQYLVRLDHCVRDKFHAVSQAMVSELGGQPLKGKRNNGGQRSGEMEFWALHSHNAVNTINSFANTNYYSEKNKTSDFENKDFKEIYLNILYAALKKINLLNKDSIEDKKINDLLPSKRKIINFLSGKDGYIRKHMLGRRIHFSGRSVLSPVPELKIDEILLPVDAAIEWFGDKLSIKNKKEKSQWLKVEIMI